MWERKWLSNIVELGGLSHQDVWILSCKDDMWLKGHENKDTKFQSNSLKFHSPHKINMVLWDLFQYLSETLKLMKRKISKSKGNKKGMKVTTSNR